MGPHDQIVVAQPQDTDVLSRVIALSFHPLDPSCWLIPDADARREIFPGYFRLYVEDAMERGRVYTTADRTAVALWFPGGDGDDSGSDSDGGSDGDKESAAAEYDAKLAAATGSWVDRFRTFDGLLDAHHPTDIRHDHLAILAVHPDHQHQGIGSRMLAVAEDATAAELMGIRPDRMQAIAWALAAGATGVAGALIANFFYVAPTVGETLAIIAFVTVALGGFGSVPGALAAGLLIGIIESVSAYAIGAIYKDIVVYALFVLVLWLRPAGLMGKA